MKILAPVRETDEIDMLHAAGAEELFCGFVPQEWFDRYQGAVWLNRRSARGSSVDTFDGMRALTQKAHSLDLPVFVTLNAPYYTAEQIDLVTGLANRLSDECDVDAFIVSDVNLLMTLAERKLRAATHVSSVAAALNVEAIRFLLDFGPTRVVLPRSVTLPEIENITGTFRGQCEIEVFMLNDGCAFEEGFCATTHHHSVGAFCTSLSGMDTEFEWRGGYFSARRQAWLRKNLEDYREWVWYLNGNGCGSTPKGLPYGPCGLCAIPDLQRMGVESLKIVGREASAFKKMASVRMVADVVKRTRQGDTKAKVMERAISLRQSPEHCASGYMCYYKVDGATSAER